MTEYPLPPAGKFASVPTPVYYYDLRLLRDTLEAVGRESQREDFHVHYAMKACNDPRVLKTIADYGLGVDVVSAGELTMALETGFKAADIVFAGVGKTDAEIETALKAGIGGFNVESLEELEIISHIAAGMGLTAPVALRINPDIDAHTHHYITTGLAENKFGISLTMLDRAVDMALALEGVKLEGLHFHIGSQITDLTPYKILCERINAMVGSLSQRGVKIANINVGGGLGIDYDYPDGCPISDFKSYFDIFKNCLILPEGCQVHFELGRAIVGQCGSLLSRVVYVKKGIGKQFVILDAGMNDLIRPALYQAHHAIENLSATERGETAESVYDVVGPVCESSDVFATDEHMPVTRRGDLIAIRSAGAYGQVMSSYYNCRHTSDRAIYSVD